jgi:hypothetical protein
MIGILTDDNGNIVVSNGRLRLGNTDAQVAQHIIVAFTGEYKHAPYIGGNAKLMIAGTINPFWEGNVKSQIKSCKVPVKKLSINTEGIELILQ